MTDEQGWGKIIIATRLEKQVSANFFQCWDRIISSGLAPGDGHMSVSGKVAHKAANHLVRRFLKTDADSLLFLDSDAIVEQDIVKKFREYEPGWQYDILQAFYIRRGWPPRPIWMRKDAYGRMTESLVMGQVCGDVDIAGTHCAIFRRRVFEAMLGDRDPESFEWFYYPRNEETSEDSACSLEARDLGFRIGATTEIQAGHLAELTVDYSSYIDYMEKSGQLAGMRRYNDLATEIAQFLGEPRDEVMAKATAGATNVKDAWQLVAPQTPEEVRAFYSRPDSGYFYDLLNWNGSISYERLMNGLRPLINGRVLVIGAGLGVEAEILARHNQVTVFELPGPLKEFCQGRLNGNVSWLDGDYLPAALEGQTPFDMVVALEVLEHIHPDEFPRTMAAIGGVIKPGGYLFCHNNWGDQDKYPMHYDNSAEFDAWCQALGVEKTGEFTWQLPS